MPRLLIEFFLRSTLIAVATGAALWALRIRAASARHAAWVGVMIAMLALPALMLWGPKASLPVLPAQPVMVIESAPVAIAETAAPIPVQSAPVAQPESHWSWDAAWIALYWLGAGVLLLRLAIGTLRAQRLTSAAISAPVTVGLLRPRIILPESSSEWPQQQLEAVMAHERAHVRRRDPLFQWLALLNRAMFWFHPLAWWLERHLAALAEEACDSAVLEQGHDPREYSLLLLDLARTVQRAGSRLNVVATTMPGAHLPQRIGSIMAGVRAPRISRTRLALAALAGAVPAALFAGATLDHTPQLLQLPMPERPVPQPPVLIAQSSVPAGAPAPAVPPPAPRLEFDVATVKPAAPITGYAPPGGMARPGSYAGGPGTARPDAVQYRWMSVKNLLMAAYSMPADQVVGPAWIDSEHYDIVGKVAPGATKAQVPMMLQNLLADRFKLVVHRETKELPLYELVVGKNGSKLKPHVDDPDAPKLGPGELAWSKDGIPSPALGELIGVLLPPGKWHYTARKQTLGKGRTLVSLLAETLGRPVIDKTGLAGEYDWELEFRDERPGRVQPEDFDAPDISTAVEEQLGLKLEAKKGPVEVLVVDSGERTPTEN